MQLLGSALYFPDGLKACSTQAHSTLLQKKYKWLAETSSGIKYAEIWPEADAL